MPARSRTLAAVFGAVLVLSVIGPVSGYGAADLEELANSDFIPELRVAASKALKEKYVREGLQNSSLLEIATEARTEELKNAAVRALTRNFEDVKRVGSLEEAREKAKELERTVRSGKKEELKGAAGRALGIYYLAFNLNEVDGYSKTDLEEMAMDLDEPGLREAAATALVSIYPNHYSAEELKELIRKTDHDLLKESAAGALAIRYYSQISPDVPIDRLREIASDEGENPWLRKAAGIAYGELATGTVPPEELKGLARNGKTSEIREGAAEAWSEVLINSDRTKWELIRMASAATGFAPAEYRSAITSALADRLLPEEPVIGGE